MPTTKSRSGLIESILFAVRQVTLILVGLHLIGGGAVAAPGQLDVSFNGNGVVRQGAQGVVLQPDGKIVVAHSGIFRATRFLPSGSVDLGFGVQGTGTNLMDFPGKVYDGFFRPNPRGIALRLDGKIVVCGNFSANSLNGYVQSTNAVIFDEAGVSTADALQSAVVTDTGAYFGAVTTDGDGSTLFVTNISGLTGPATVTVTRIPTSGAPQAWTTESGGRKFRAIAVQPDGKIIIAGEHFALMRFFANGAPDTSFNGTGTAFAGFNYSSTARALAVQSDGKIVAAGWLSGGGDSFAVVRFLADGTLDPTFGQNGRFTLPRGLNSIEDCGVVIQPNGKIIVAGSTDTGARLFRLTVNGILDPSWGGTGQVDTYLNPLDPANTSENEVYCTLLAQPDGEIVFAGAGGVARYLVDETTAPVIWLSNSPLSYQENAFPGRIADSSSVGEAGHEHFNGGSLTVSLGDTGASGDRLTIRGIGTAAGQIGISGSIVTYGGIPIGTFTGGTDGSTPLVISFTSTTATTAAVGTLLGALFFETTGEDPLDGVRRLAFTLVGSDGVSSTPVERLLTVLARNDAPTLDAIPNQNPDLGSGQISIPLTGISTGGEVQTLTITATSSNPAYVPDPTIVFDGSSTTAQLTYIAPDQPGTAVITVVVKDNGGTANSGTDTVTRSFTIKDTSTRPAVSAVTAYAYDTSARVDGTVDARGSETTVVFQYGLSPDFTASRVADPFVVPANATNAAVMATLDGITSGPAYVYRLVATNSNGTTYGATHTFVVPPSIKSETASNIASTSATVSAVVSGGGTAASVALRYKLESESEYSTVEMTPNTVGALTTSPVTVNLTGLIPERKYRCFIEATNSGGIRSSYSFIVFTTLGVPPSVQLGGVSNVSATGATITGSVTAGSSNITVSIYYGSGATLTSSSVMSPAVLANTTGSVTGNLTGLSPNTLYAYRLIATNGTGTATTETSTFTTAPGTPTIADPLVENLTQTSATVRSVVSGRGAAASVIVRYGLLGLDSSVAATPAATDPAEGTLVSALIPGLQPDMAYFYRIEATNSAGTTLSETKTFTTKSVSQFPPSVTGSMIANVSATGATISGTVAGGGSAASVVLHYGVAPNTNLIVTMSPGSVAANSTAPVSVSLTGLQAGKTYACRIAATNADGTTFGETLQFSTLGVAPTVQLNAAADLTGTSAKISGLVAAGSSGATVEIEYGPGATLTDTAGTTPATVAANNNQSVAGTLTGLTPDTLYSFRMKVTSAAGSQTSETLTFTTLPGTPVIEDTKVESEARTRATVHALVLGRGASASVLVRYGSPGLDTSVVATPASTDPREGTPVSAELVGLQPSTVYSYRIEATNSAGVTLGETRTFTTPENGLPEAADDYTFRNGPSAVSLEPLTNDSDPDDDALTITAVTQGAHGAVSFSGETITYTPQGGDPVEDSFTYTISDGKGGTDVGTVTVGSGAAIYTIGRVTGEPVPDEPAGTVYAAFGTPTTGAFAGVIQNSTGHRVRAIFAADGRVALRVGGPAPAIPSAVIADLSEPSGDVVMARLIRGPGSVTGKNDTVLYDGIGDSIEIAARTGVELGAPAGVLRRIRTFDGNGSTIFLSGDMQKTGRSGGSELTIQAYDGESLSTVWARKYPDQNIRSFRSLTAPDFSPAEGRWRVSPTKLGSVVSTSSGVFFDFGTPTDSGLLSSDLSVPGGQSLVGAPVFTAHGVAYKARSRKGDVVLQVQSAEGTVEIARVHGMAPDSLDTLNPGMRFSSISDPVAGSNGRVAFSATVKGSATNATNRRGIWIYDGGLRLVARSGEEAPGYGRWHSFESLVFPDGPTDGPLFTARVKLPSDQGTHDSDHHGLWGTDSHGHLRLLMHTDKVMEVNGAPRTVKSFAAIQAANLSRGAAQGYGDEGVVAVVVTFTDGIQAIVQIDVP